MVALLAVLLPSSLILFTPSLRATSNIITVNTTSDSSASSDGLCSLREAISNANAASDTTGGDCAAGTGTDSIVFSVSGTITLGSALPAILNSLTIDGSGHSVIIDGANSYQILATSSSAATLTLNSLTLQNGRSSLNGGALSNAGATLYIQNCNLSNNSAGFAPCSGSSCGGGGVYNYAGGQVSITNTTFSGNFGTFKGGALFSNDGGVVTVSGSNFSGNTAGGLGGAIWYNTSNLTIDSSTFLNNSAGFQGGAINAHSVTVTGSTFANNNSGNGGGVSIFDGPASFTNTTFSGNAADHGGGIFLNRSGTAMITACTFSSNSSGDGGAEAGGRGDSIATFQNSILSGSGSGGNCSGPTVNGGYNIGDDATCGFGTSVGANGSTIGDNVNPLLDGAGLQNNGGPTQTIALQQTSPAVDAVPVAGCTATDQRGMTRPDPGESTCDIGAYESSFLSCNTISISGSMDGNLPIAPGSTVQAGYDFTMPGSHPDAHVTFNNASVTLQVICPDNSVHPLTITLPTQTYDDPLNSSAWLPSGDQNSALVYQGSTISSACGTQTGHAPQGATFSAQVCSDDAISKVNVRFHYRDNSSGGWSGTKTVIP